MNIRTCILLASGRLKPYESMLRKRIKKYISAIFKFLPLKDIDIIVLDNPEGVISHLGVGGYAMNGNTLYINLDPGHKEFKKVVNVCLFSTLAHELHHVMRFKTVGYGNTLFEALISEGLADHFDIEVTRQKPPDWSTALSEKQIQFFLKKAAKDFNNQNYIHRDWFFGSEKRKIPKWTGYSLGFFLVQNYLKNYPKKKASMLHKTKASEFLKNS